jgi:membrane protease YdiL (CAAX protease family)
MNQVPGESREFELSKLATCFVLMFLAYWFFSAIGNFFISRFYLPGHKGLHAGEVVYTGSALLILVEMVVVLWAYRPMTLVLANRSATSFPSKALALNLLTGVLAGFAGLVCSLPLLRSMKTEFFVATIVPKSHSIGPQVILVLFLFGICLPVAAEMVFRGVAQRVLERHLTPFSAILLGAVLFASFWPFFGFPVALVLGLVSATLFWWRGSVLSCIVANSIMTISATAYVALRV